MRCIRCFKSERQKLFTNDRGNTLVEMVMVMLLIILFGATIYTLICTGGNTQADIIGEKNANMEARVAISYINARLRQNDVAGRIAVSPRGESGQNGIVIRERGGEWDLDTWIYWSDGVLKECLVDPGSPPADTPGMFTPIASISGFRVWATEDGSVAVRVSSEYKGKTREYESEISLRTGQVAQ